MRSAIAVLGLLASTSLASAADFGGPYEPYGGSVKDGPIIAMPFSWTGFYIGANVGYGWGKADADRIPDDLNGIPDGGLDLSAEPDGWFGGGQIGYNIQFGQTVFGIEVDLQGANLEDSITFIPADPGLGGVSVDVSSFGSVRGRLGLALDRVMPYVTGGFAWAKTDADISVTYPAPGPGTFTGGDSATHTGWVIGGGVEVALDSNWSAKAEYLYYDLGEKGYSFTLLGNGPTNTYNTDVDLTLQTFRIGVNYKFSH